MDPKPTFLSELAVQNEADVDAVLAAYLRQELAISSKANKPKQPTALVRHGNVVLNDDYYRDHHSWGDRCRVTTSKSYRLEYQTSKTFPTLKKYKHTRPNLPSIITYVDSAAAPYPSASEKLKARDPQDVLPRGKKRERAKVIMRPMAGEVFTQDKHPLFRDESSSSDAESTSLSFTDGRQIKRRKMSNEANSTLCMGREKSVQTGPIAESITALALQTNMAITALALQMNRDRDEIWKDLRGWLDRIIGLRDDSLTLCGDVRDDVFRMTSEDLDGKDPHGCSEPNEFVRLRGQQSSPPTVGADQSQARNYKVSNGGHSQDKVSGYEPQTTTLIPREAPNSSYPCLPLMPPVNPSVTGDELSASLAQVGHQAFHDHDKPHDVPLSEPLTNSCYLLRTATWTVPKPSPYSGMFQRTANSCYLLRTATWTMPKPSPYSDFKVSNGADSQPQTTTLISRETPNSDNASEVHIHVEADEALDASNGLGHLDSEQRAWTREDRNCE